MLVSLGSLVVLDQARVDRMAAAFAAIAPTRVIWKLGGGVTPSQPSDNLKLVQWMPQNDLLGHAKVKVFVTHRGRNSIEEASYHGVPMVGIPCMADQPDNILLVLRKGYGVNLDFKNFTAEDLENGIR